MWFSAAAPEQGKTGRVMGIDLEVISTIRHSISVPVDRSRCLREEEVAPHPDQLLSPIHHSTLQMLTRQHQWGTKGAEAENPPGTALLFHGAGSGAHQTAIQDNQPPSPVLPPRCSAAALHMLAMAPVLRCMRPHLSRPDCPTGAYAN